MAKLPTLAFVSDAVYPYNKGGKETRLFEITTRLSKRGYDVHIYCMKWWDGTDDRVENGVTLHGICPLMPLYDGPRRSIKQGVLFGLACFRLITAKFDVVDVDHMPFFPLYSMRVVCWLKGKKMIATWHEVWGQKYWQEYLGGVKGHIAWWIERVSVLFPDQINAVSQMTADRLRKQLKYSGKLSVISNGIDLKGIQSAKKSSQTSDVIFAGRLLKHKNVDVLLKAIDIVRNTQPDVKLIIAGEGPEKENLLSLSKKLKIEKNVEFLPFQEDIKDLYGLIKASKVFVLPSEREGFGLVVLEANACGVPVITVNCPDNAAKELVTNTSGTVVALNSAEVAKAILEYFEAPHHAASNNYNSYSWDLTLNRLIKGMSLQKPSDLVN